MVNGQGHDHQRQHEPAELAEWRAVGEGGSSWGWGDEWASKSKPQGHVKEHGLPGGAAGGARKGSKKRCGSIGCARVNTCFASPTVEDELEGMGQGL